jgi:hypothetical protein
VREKSKQHSNGEERPEDGFNRDEALAAGAVQREKERDRKRERETQR